MAENLMPKVAELLGVEIGEEFIIEDADLTITVVLSMNGFNIIRPNNVEESNNNLLLKVLQGLYKVKKKPWEPKNGDRYYATAFTYYTKPYITWYIWSGRREDYASLRLGIIHKTEEEAKSHMADDYERLTSKKLEG